LILGLSPIGRAPNREDDGSPSHGAS
jgi:hypothetical protein